MSDEPVAQLCRSIGVEWVRGSLDDVLDRFYQAAKPHQPKHVVRLTGDCPLADPELIDRVIDHYLAGEYDYACNCLQPSYPDGLDVEVFRFSALEEAWKEAKLPSQREHVTPFIHQQPQRYKLADYRSPVDLSSLRWTVDHRADYELVSRIYEALYPSNPAFTTQDILDLLEARPELKTWNTQHSRNEGYGQSLEEDRKYLEP